MMTSVEGFPWHWQNAHAASWQENAAGASTSGMTLDNIFRGLSGHPYAVSAEKAFLYLAANVHANEKIDMHVRAILARPIRWDYVLELSQVHGVTGLVRYCLRNGGYWNSVPEPLRRALDSWHHTMRIRHLMLARQLSTLLVAAQEAGIVPVILKGAALGATAYPDPALRPMVDIDILVRPHEIAAMAEVMGRLGYVSDEIYYSDAFNRAHGYHLLFTHTAGDIHAVEVHWRLASRLEERNALSAAMLQARTMQASVASLPGVAGREAHILTPEAHVVFLATHATKERHVFSELKLLADIAALVGGPQAVDWTAVACLARQAQARTATYVTLALARALLGARVPPAILEELRPPRPLLCALERSLNPPALLDPITDDRRAIVKYLVVDSPTIMVKMLREHLLPPPGAVREYYPELRSSSLPAAYIRHVASIGMAAVRKTGLWLRLDRRD